MFAWAEKFVRNSSRISQTDIDELIEVGIAVAKEAIEQYEALERLKRNADFDLLVTTGYFGKEASRLCLFKAAPGAQEDGMQASITKAIDSVGYLQQYFLRVEHFGKMAHDSLAADRETREELLAEEL